MILHYITKGDPCDDYENFPNVISIQRSAENMYCILWIDALGCISYADLVIDENHYIMIEVK